MPWAPAVCLEGVLGAGLLKNLGLLLEDDLGGQSGELGRLVTGPEGKDLLGLGGPGEGKWDAKGGAGASQGGGAVGS